MLPKIKKLLFEVEFQQNESPYQRKNGDNFSIRFQQLRQALISNLQSFIPVDVIPRQPPSSYAAVTTRYDKSTYIDTKKNKVVHYPRPNSFEIYVDNFLLFSHLESGAWPDINAICDWALRVAEKIIDLEIKQEEEGMPQGLKNVKQLQEQSQSIRINQGTEQKAYQVQQNRGFPPVGHVYRSSVNRTKFQGKFNNQFQRQTRYSSLRDKNIDKSINFNKTQRNSFSTARKNKINSIEQNSYNYQNTTRSKDFGFHWHLQNKHQTISIQQKQGINYHTIEAASARARMAEYTPVPAVNQRALIEKIEEYRKQNKLKLNKIDLKLSQSILNCFRIHYKFDGNKIKKISHDCQWSPLLCESPLPLNGQYYLNIIVHISHQNNIVIGLAPISYYPSIENKQSFDNLLCFNIGTGQIKDCTSLEQRETAWRDYGKKYTESKPFSFKMIVNMSSKIVEWHANNQKISSTILPNSFKYGFRAFISLHNIYDLVYANSQLKSSQQTTPNKQQTADRQIIDTSNKPSQKQYSIRKNIQSVNAQQQTLKIDDAFNSTPAFEGRIKRQRLQRFIDKNSAKKIQALQQSTVKKIQQEGQTIKYQDNLKAFHIRNKELEEKQNQIKKQSPPKGISEAQSVTIPNIQSVQKETHKKNFVIINETKMNRKGINGTEKDISVIIVKQNNAETISETHKQIQQIQEPPKQQKIDVILLAKSPSEVEKQSVINKQEIVDQVESKQANGIKQVIIQQNFSSQKIQAEVKITEIMNHQAELKILQQIPVIQTKAQIEAQINNEAQNTQIQKVNEEIIQLSANKEEIAQQNIVNHSQAIQQQAFIQKNIENQHNELQQKVISNQQKQVKNQGVLLPNQAKQPLQINNIAQEDEIIPNQQQKIVQKQEISQQNSKQHKVDQNNQKNPDVQIVKQITQPESTSNLLTGTILNQNNPQQLHPQDILIHQEMQRPSQANEVTLVHQAQSLAQKIQQSPNPIPVIFPPHETTEVVKE